MERLKELRTALRITQAQLAERLKTTQQTIARWETGKSEPSLAALRDLAVICGTSVDDLLGHNPLASTDRIASNRPRIFDDGNAGFWGHLGIQLPGAKHSRWYPITDHQRDLIQQALSSGLDGPEWITVSTLNNRMLALRIPSIARLRLLGHAMDQPEDDWELTWDAGMGFPQEIYQGLIDWSYGRIQGDEGYSEEFRMALNDIVAMHELTEDFVSDQVLSTQVIRRDGLSDRFLASGQMLWEIASSIEAEEAPTTFALEEHYGEIEVFYPSAQVAMLDMPLREVIAAAASELKMYEAGASKATPTPSADVVPTRKRGRPRKRPIS